MFKLERGKTYQCVELVSGKQKTGSFYFDDGKVETKFIFFNESEFLNDAGPVYLKADNGTNVSIFENFSDSLITGSGGPSPNMLHHQIIHSNIVIAGPDRWRPENLVYKVEFELEGCGWLITNNKKIKSIIASIESSSEKNPELFNIVIGDQTYSVWYPVVPTLGPVGVRSDRPRFVIEFTHGKSLDDYRMHLAYYVSFFSFCIGQRLTPENIRIFRVPIREKSNQTNWAELTGYSVEYLRPKRPKLDDGTQHGSPFWFHRDEHLSDACEGLKKWLRQEDEWRDVRVSMDRVLDLQSEMTEERIMAANRWFDAIPKTKRLTHESPDDIKKIIDAAKARAEKLGMTEDVIDRIKTELGKIRNESQKHRVERLIDCVKMRFAQISIPDLFTNDVFACVAQYRNKAAHKFIHVEEDKEFQKLCDAVCAVEALCFLLMAEDLLVDADAETNLPGCETTEERMRRDHPLLRNYFDSFRVMKELDEPV